MTLPFETPWNALQAQALDGDERKHHNFCTYSVHGLPNPAPAGFMIPFSDGHTRRLSRLTRGPFRYGTGDTWGTVNL
jgi:hypothetical protein